MVDIPIPPKWKQLWDTWDLRGLIIFSLSLQTLLILIAPLRKRTKSNWILMLLWSAYVLADWSANFAIGLIWNNQGNIGASSSQNGEGVNDVDNEDLFAFWTPFLLVHLGGPDTITAFTLEDNELWLRHLLSLVFMCLSVVYVFIQSLPRNQLWIPTMLMIMTGIIKYAERTCALYFASADGFKNSMRKKADPGLNYEKLMGDYLSKENVRLPTRTKMVPYPDRPAKLVYKAKRGNLTELEVLQYAFRFFETFKGLIVDVNFSQKERSKSRSFFLNRSAKDAFKVVEVELNFIYEFLFTKLPAVYGLVGALSRLFSLVTICLAIVLFIEKGKSKLSGIDVKITYGLLVGALVLEMINWFMLVFSDWTVVSLWKSPDDKLDDKSLRKRILRRFIRLMTEGTLQDSKGNTLKKPNKPPTCRKPIWFLKPRWSESISTFNLINYCLHPHSSLLKFGSGKLGLSGFFDDIKYVEHKNFTVKLKDFIFKELKLKSKLADDVKTTAEVSSARGDLVLRMEEGWDSLIPYVLNVDYDQSLLLWHIATDICYYKELNDDLKSKKATNRNKDYQEIAKLISDYMLYLLIMQPNMMSSIGGIGQIRFRDTCAEAKRFFESRKGNERNQEQRQYEGYEDAKVDWEHINACIEILAISTEIPPSKVKGNSSKALLFDGCILARELIKTEEEDRNLNKWLILSKVWVELLCYGAINSRGNMQVAQVSKGGELITIIWLLMTHFGLGDQFQINEGQAIAKFVVCK